MNDYKSACKKLRTVSPEIYEAVQAHVGNLRRTLEIETERRRSAENRNQDAAAALPPPPVVQTTMASGVSHVRFADAEKKIRRLERKLSENQTTAEHRDKIEKAVATMQGVGIAINALRSQQVHVSSDIATMTLIATYLGAATELSDNSDWGLRRCVTSLVRCTMNIGRVRQDQFISAVMEAAGWSSYPSSISSVFQALKSPPTGYDER